MVVVVPAEEATTGLRISGAGAWVDSPGLGLPWAALPGNHDVGEPHPAEPDPVTTERLDRFRSGEQTVAAFCAAEGVSVPAFYQWKRQLAAATAGPAHLPALLRNC